MYYYKISFSVKGLNGISFIMLLVPSANVAEALLEAKDILDDEVKYINTEYTITNVNITKTDKVLYFSER